ncbi:hypothetical protein BDV59DRAFT_179079, partial [Aspergillus ambiguus]|uniref:uncharacterized protein n=1 Tax=Aspergillus ambiguus TaxID=176160 RepID=UPI003CCE40A9
MIFVQASISPRSGMQGPSPLWPLTLPSCSRGLDDPLKGGKHIPRHLLRSLRKAAKGCFGSFRIRPGASISTPAVMLFLPSLWLSDLLHHSFIHTFLAINF